MHIWKEKARGIDSPLESFRRSFGPQDNFLKKKNFTTVIPDYSSSRLTLIYLAFPYCQMTFT